jgi:hypothetical protein
MNPINLDGFYFFRIAAPNRLLPKNKFPIHLVIKLAEKFVSLLLAH